MKDRLSQVYIDEQNKLGNYIRSRINNNEEAEDLLQDVFYSAVDNLNSLQSVDNLIGYLYTIAKNKITDWYRKKKLKTVSIHSEDDFVLEYLIEDVCENIEDEYLRSLIEDQVINAINELPDEQKEVFVANEIEGVSFKEMSEKNNVSINTLLARKRYAVINLRKKLKDIKAIVDNN